MESVKSIRQVRKSLWWKGFVFSLVWKTRSVSGLDWARFNVPRSAREGEGGDAEDEELPCVMMRGKSEEDCRGLRSSSRSWFRISIDGVMHTKRAICDFLRAHVGGRVRVTTDKGRPWSHCGREIKLCRYVGLVIASYTWAKQRCSYLCSNKT